MQTAKQHYDRLLGHHYSWMLGDTAPVIRIFAGMLQHYSVVPNPHGVAIDLGAGNGIHSMLLAQMGYAVTAIDLCAALLQELQDRTLSLPVKTICDDFLQFRQYCSDTADLIVCAGDSLAHLSGWGQVDSLLADVYAALSDGGLLYLSFRDHAAVSAGTTSIVPVKSDREKILTCILQYSDTHIEVTDVLYQLQHDKWIFEIGSYNKLKITKEVLLESLSRQNFHLLRRITANGMEHVLVRK